MSSKVTLKHIAEALGVSVMTVSRAINKKNNVDTKTRERILSKAREMGYTPNLVAKSLVSSKTYTIGVVIPQISHAFFPEVVKGIEEVTFAADYQLFLTNTNEQFEREKDSINTLYSKRVDGILISSSLKAKDYSFYKDLIAGGLSIVFFDRYISGIGASCVGVDDRTGFKNITRHLIGHGYRRIAHLCGHPNVSIGKERLHGYKDALKEGGLPVDEELIVECDFNEQGGYSAMKKLLALPPEQRPHAVAAVNDPSAFGALEAIREAGLTVPDDIAITGFTDEIRSPLLHVPLTTVHQPAYELGKHAAHKLIRTIENDDEPVEHDEIPTELAIRRSCGCPGQNSF